MNAPSSASPDLNHSLSGHGIAKYRRPTKPAGSKTERMAGLGAMTSPDTRTSPGAELENAIGTASQPQPALIIQSSVMGCVRAASACIRAWSGKWASNGTSRPGAVSRVWGGVGAEECDI